MSYTIQRCMGCGKPFRVYMWVVYEGDTRYCRSCNEVAEG